MVARTPTTAPALASLSLRTSSATTAKPRPASPARAASIAAFKANNLVCDAIASIWPTTVVISPRRATRSSSSVAASAGESTSPSRWTMCASRACWAPVAARG